MKKVFLTFAKRSKEMDHVLNIVAVKKRLKSKPKDYKLYFFFRGMPGQLSKKEIEELKKVCDAEHKKLISFLDKAKTA